MSEANKEPAFPRDHAHDGHNGMTLRDYFAAKAMPLAYEAWMHDYYVENPDEVRDGFDDNMKLIAEDAYAMADAMLKARSK